MSLSSSLTHLAMQPLAVEYKLNEWTERCSLNGPLAVFETEQLARNFLIDDGATNRHCEQLQVMVRSLRV